uniref:hypothetical protein n=1 Tax=Flavobacterium sp. TaxID=239 RepID=UPI00404B08D7
MSSQIKQINHITEELIACTQLEVFQNLLQEHEAVLSIILEMQTVQETFFSDFNGAVKSLGAWGGDFVMAVSNKNPTDYFKEKGFETIIKYQDMVL